MAQKERERKHGFWDRGPLTNGEMGGSICKLSGSGQGNMAETKENWKNLKIVIDKTDRMRYYVKVA